MCGLKHLFIQSGNLVQHYVLSNSQVFYYGKSRSLDMDRFIYLGVRVRGLRAGGLLILGRGCHKSSRKQRAFNEVIGARVAYFSLCNASASTSSRLSLSSCPLSSNSLQDLSLLVGDHVDKFWCGFLG